MNLLLDTNILLWIARDKSETKVLEFINPHNKVIYTSIVCVGEIQSISIQSKWGKNKIEILESFLENVRIIEVSEYLLRSYVEIDTFSQRLNPNFGNYKFDTPRNMGKNDLWIASTASILNLTLISTDDDFDHLSPDFISLKRIRPEVFQELLKS